MLNIQKRCAPRQTFDAELVLPFELRQKTRLRTQTTVGEEAGLFLPRGSSLRDGDFLEAQDGRIVRVRAKPEQVLQIGCADAVQLARIAYHLGNRHVPVQVGSNWLRIANLSFDTQGRQVAIDDQPQALSARETAVLELLMRSKGRVVSKKQVEDHLYGHSGEVASNAIEVYVHRLRKQLSDRGARVQVHTIRGVGYLIAEEK